MEIDTKDKQIQKAEDIIEKLERYSGRLKEYLIEENKYSEKEINILFGDGGNMPWDERFSMADKTIAISNIVCEGYRRWNANLEKKKFWIGKIIDEMELSAKELGAFSSKRLGIYVISDRLDMLKREIAPLDEKKEINKDITISMIQITGMALKFLCNFGDYSAFKERELNSSK